MRRMATPLPPNLATQQQQPAAAAIPASKAEALPAPNLLARHGYRHHLTLKFTTAKAKAKQSGVNSWQAFAWAKVVMNLVFIRILAMSMSTIGKNLNRIFKLASVAAFAFGATQAMAATNSTSVSPADAMHAQHPQNEVVKVCAVPQLYQAVNMMHNVSKVKFEPTFATATELYAMIANAPENNTVAICDVVLSSDERLPISLIRAQRAVGSSMIPFARAPLVFWSRNPRIFNTSKGHDPQSLLKAQQIKSIAIAAPELTPVGFATSQIFKKNEFNASYLKDKTYKSDHEYQVYSMVSNGNVQVGVISKPLVAQITRELNGSYYEVPRTMHSDIQYYAVIMEQSKTNLKARNFISALQKDAKIHEILNITGFSSITPE